MLIDTMFARDMYQVYEINDDWLINSWATTWQLKIAINKCQRIHISLSIIAVLPKFSLNGNILSSCSSCRDLGIIIDPRLSFIEHINSMVAN